MKNYLIGIGGTGARVIEAAIFLSYAGLGPGEFSIIIIDPDEANGNLTRTKSLIELYKICKDSFPDFSSQNFLLKTKITTSNKFIWSIFERHNYTLSDHIAYPLLKTTNRNLADFVSVLFTEEELNTPLNEGFRGHPSIGAVVMSEFPDDQEPWKTFWSHINDYAKDPFSARVFIVGSLFGGTGASGIPTIGKLLKQHDKAIIRGGNESRNKILLGGAFGLPYFTFDVPDEETLENQSVKMFVTPEHFMIATKSALRYYDTKELPFDQVYLIGNYSPGKVGKFSPGSKTQENLPNYIELIMALAAFDFFSQPDVKEQSETKFFYAGRSDTITWEDIPVTRDRLQRSLKIKEFKTNLIITTLFSYIISTFGEKILNTRPDEIHYTWFRDNFKKNEEFPQYVINMNSIKNLINLSNNFLWWLASISDAEFKLFDISKITGEKPEIGKKLSLIDPEKQSYNVSLLLSKEDDRRREKEFNAFINILNKTKVEKRISPASRYIELFFNASKKFAYEVYNI